MKYALAVTTAGILLCCGCGESSTEPSTQNEPLTQQEASQSPSDSQDGSPAESSPSTTGSALEIVDKAIEAQGGEAMVRKLRTMRIKLNGKGAMIPGQAEIAFAIEDTWQMPDRYKTVSEFEFQGNRVSQTQIINGDQGWMNFNGQTQPLPVAALTEMKEQKYAEDLDRLLDLKSDDYNLEVLSDEVNVDGQPTVGIKISREGHRNVELYFDKSTGLLLKRKQAVLDAASGMEIAQEVIFSNYEDVDGVKHWKKLVAYRAGKKFLEGTVTEIEFLEKIDEAEFAAPVKPAPRPKDLRTSAELKTKTGTLYGTFDLPDRNGPFPVVVIIAGSGPTDRDGNQRLMKNDSLKLLGAGLAAKGIAALRYDKRGIGESAPAGGKEEDFRFEMLVDDATAWVEQLRKDKRFSKVGIIGHSEGSLIGTFAAKQAKADAFVSIAGMGRRFSELLREQLTKNLAQRPDLRKRSLQILDELVAGRTVEEVPPELVAEFRPSVQPYVISSFKYDPIKQIASLEMPVMIVQGTTDIQVLVEDAKRLAAANKNAQLSIVNGMNHVMKHATTQPEQQAAYTDPSLPLVPKLLDDMTAFLAKAFKE